MAKKAREHEISAKLPDFEQQYRLLAPLANRFCSEVREQLERLLEERGISLGFPIQHRVKDWASIVGKLERVPLRLNTLEELQDIIGFRIVLQFRRDVELTCDLLSQHLAVIDRYDTQERLREDQFGYSSVHFVVKLPEAWLAVPTLAGLGALQAEVQVRTLAQHIWATASHTLQYKQEENVPLPVRRAIHRVSALLETVDLEFERVLEERDEYRSSIDLRADEEQLNVDLLEKVLDSILPAANKEPGHEEYSGVLRDLAEFGITTPAKLAELLHKHMDAITAADAQQARSADKSIMATVAPYMGARLDRGVYFLHSGLVRRALRHEFGAPWEDYVKAVYESRTRLRE